MAEALVKFSLQGLKSLALQESQIFSGLEDQTQSLVTILDEIGGFYDSVDRMTEKYYKFESHWFHILRDVVHNMEDYIDDFIIQMEDQSESGRIVLVDRCRIELEMLKESLVQIMYKMSEDKKEKAVKVETDEVKESSSQADESEASSSPTPIKFYHINIPYYLQSCLMYCGIFPEKYAIPKGRLVRLLVAEGLIQEKPGEILEDIAEENIKKLVEFRLLQMVDETKLEVSEQIREFMLGLMGQEDFIVSCTSSDTNIPPTTRRLSIHSDTKNIPANSSNLPIQSLFMFGIESLSEAEFDCLRPLFLAKKFLRVLDLEGVRMAAIPDEVGDLIHLRYLSLKKTDIEKLPESVSSLRNLQTLDVRWNKFPGLPSGILNLVELRHLKMFKHWGVSGVLVPVGIGGSKNLQTLTGLNAGGGIAGELGELAQLRKLGIMDLTEDDVSEVCVSIMKMKELLSLSLTAKSSFPAGSLPPIEQFSPPTLLQKLCLEGGLEKLPSWFSSMENLSKLRLGFSHLSEDPALVLQFLPNLKHLTLWRAYEGKKIGKEFCGVGGFPKLEVLVIASHVLEEWTELEEGALPRLKRLNMHNCLKLRKLPEGLQHVTTLEELKLLPLLDDHAERLKPDGGEENYKISHIPVISFVTTSIVQQHFENHPAQQCS